MTDPNPTSFDDCYGGDEPTEGQEHATPDIDGWWSPEPKLFFCGQIAGSFTITDVDPDTGERKTRTVVPVRLTRPCKAQTKEGPVRLEPDQVLGVSITTALEPMLEYVEHRGKVFARAEELLKRGRRKFWKYETLKLAGKRSPAPVTRAAEPSSETGGDDIPF